MTRARGAVWLTLLAGLAGCAGSDRGEVESDSLAASPPPLGVHTAAALDSASTRFVDFLRGRVHFDSIALADSVVLVVSPEGGGARSVVPREALRDPAAWRVGPGSGPGSYAIAPPAGVERLTTRVGRHLNCLEYSLTSRSAELARLPHVGNMLTPATGEPSCLQSWNLTVVFDSTRRPPTVVAVVYDQWEW